MNLLNSEDKGIIRELQQDIPVTERPFKVIAEKLGLSEEYLINRIKYYLKKGYIRRFGAALRHREMGLTYNPMIVLKVRENKIEEAGRKLASFKQVTHCYQRRPQEDFPYNLYAMVHCQHKRECENLLKEILKAVEGIEDYLVLYSTEELKKTSMKYFIDG